MTRKRNADETPLPDVPSSLIPLLRVEERVERVPITAEQAKERMSVAAGMIQEASVLAMEHADLAAKAKAAKQAAEAKQAESNRIVLDAQGGTMAAPYAVLVERHPTHPTEMVVWRPPDGAAAQELLEATRPPERALFEWREAQGCVQIEVRAMTPDELLTRESVDQLQLNLDPRNPEPAAAAEPAPTGKGTSPPPICPFIVKEEEEPSDDLTCGEPGVRRLRGFCHQHAEELGGSTQLRSGAPAVHIIARKIRREALARGGTPRAVDSEAIAMTEEV